MAAITFEDAPEVTYFFIRQSMRLSALESVEGLA